MGQRYILALVLMIVVMFAWSLLFGTKQRTTPDEGQTSEQTREAQLPPVNRVAGNSQERIDEVGRQTRVQQRTEARVQTDLYDIIFAVELAIAKKWSLRKYGNRSDAGKLLNLIPPTALNCLALQFSDPQLQVDTMQAVWTVDKTEVHLSGEDSNMEDSITFNTRIGENLKISKKFTFYQDSYYVDLALMFQNLSGEPLSALQLANQNNESGYTLRWGPGITADLLPHEKRQGGKRRPTRGEGARAYTGFGNPAKELDEAHLTGPVLWAGLNNNYFAALMIPAPGLDAQYRFEELKDNGTPPAADITAPTDTASLMIPGFSLAAKGRRTDIFRVYVGPKDTAILKQVQDPGASETEIRLSKIIDFGSFWLVDLIIVPISWALLWLLNGLHAIFPNYGIAIILLTGLLKVAVYPLTYKGHKSMKEMQKLQPLLTELREKHRDDPQKLNKATMRLYKEHGVNPLGGCIPWIPQIPILWALFSLLRSAVELRGAPFLLWINDLSAPDAILALPFMIPLVNIDTLRLLPLINGLTAWLQQRMMGNMMPVTDNMQAKLMQFMPLIFVFVLYNWASGLILYWTCSNVFTIGQQYLQSRGSDTAEETKAKPLASTKESMPPKKVSSSKQKRKK